MYFHYVVIISPRKMVWPFIWTNFNLLHPKMLCAKFGWIWPSGSGEEVENRKSLQTDGGTDGRTDGRTDRRRTTGYQKSSPELSAQVSWKLNLLICFEIKQNTCISCVSVYISLTKLQGKIYTYKLTNCTNKLRNASTRVNNYICITTLDKRWS